MSVPIPHKTSYIDISSRTWKIRMGWGGWWAGGLVVVVIHQYRSEIWQVVRLRKNLPHLKAMEKFETLISTLAFCGIFRYDLSCKYLWLSDRMNLRRLNELANNAQNSPWWPWMSVNDSTRRPLGIYNIKTFTDSIRSVTSICCSSIYRYSRRYPSGILARGQIFQRHLPSYRM